MRGYCFAALLLLSMPAAAVAPYGGTPGEQAMCQVRVFSRLGTRDQNTMHMHHYCDGLRFLDRAYASLGDKREMGYNLDVAINNFNYVLNATQKDYSMRGEVHLGKARALKLKGRTAEALGELQQAMSYKLDTPELYRSFADFYEELGNKAKALEMVTEGLSLNPGDATLQRRYTRLGGKLPYPEPSRATPPSEPAQTEAQPAPPATTPPDVSKTSEPEKTPQIGSPTNPHCRFCPN